MNVGTVDPCVAPMKYMNITIHGIRPANDPNMNAVQFVFSVFWL